MPTKPVKLKPCPFCGGKLEVVVTIHEEVHAFHAGCSFLDRFPWKGFSKEALERAWNRRAPAKKRAK